MFPFYSPPPQVTSRWWFEVKYPSLGGSFPCAICMMLALTFLGLYHESSAEAVPLILLMLYKMPSEESLSDPLAHFKMLKFIASSLSLGHILLNSVDFA